METYHGTTIVSVRRGPLVAIGGDGQVTLGNIVIKSSARKVFGDTTTALNSNNGTFAIALPTRALRVPWAILRWIDREASLIITGNGDVLEPEYGIVAIGSGGAFAQAAARALVAHTEMTPSEIVKRSLEIAGDICIYTNHSHTVETLE